MNLPNTTYRLQFHSGFTFESAAALIPYFKDLGVTHIYSSPILQTRRGSLHGYDLVDPTEVNLELGGRDQFDALITKAQDVSIGWIQDIVSNHMAYDPQNRYCMDIIENGESSRYRDYFDVDWDTPFVHLQGKIIAPFLAEFYGTCLDRGEIQLQIHSEGFSFHYYDLAFPMRVEDYSYLLLFNIADLEKRLGSQSEEFLLLSSLIHEFEKFPLLHDAKESFYRLVSLKSSLYSLFQRSQAIHEYIINLLEYFNGHKFFPQTMSELDTLLLRQNFRLSYWKVSNEEVNYRRFFTINNLIALNMANSEAFDFVHGLIFSLLHEKKIDGLRIDHIDGLYNPVEYISKIRTVFKDLYIVAEKVLNLSETLPPELEVQGTTGYDFLNIMNGLFVEQKNWKKFDAIYHAYTGFKMPFADLVIRMKHLFMDRCLAGDIYNLAYLLKSILGKNRYGRDMTVYGLKRGIFEVLAHFPVYRTYVAKNRLTRRDETYIRESVAAAKNSFPSLQYELDLIERILLLAYGPETPPDERQEWVRFVQRFQQISSALMAKGMEDTIFYVYNRLLSLNEVGGDPNRFGISLNEFHDYNAKKIRALPHSWNTTSTHDTKRGEDLRARLNVLSEMPKEWSNFLKACVRINRPLKQFILDEPVPDRNEEYSLYQTLIGAFPFLQEERDQFQARMETYLIKSLREAKVHTSWNNQDLAYENACLDFLRSLFHKERSSRFWELFLSFQKKISFYGVFNSLSQVLLKASSPGVFDLYQGAELWDLNLVDPDNRRPVDFATRASFLREIQSQGEALQLYIQKLFNQVENGKIKLFALHRLLKARREYRELFERGDYLPLKTTGVFWNNVVAFARKNTRGYLLAIAPRFFSQVVPEGVVPLGRSVWNDTAILLSSEFPSIWKDLITGRTLQKEEVLYVGNILEEFPISLLVSVP